MKEANQISFQLAVFVTSMLSPYILIDAGAHSWGNTQNGEYFHLTLYHIYIYIEREREYRERWG